MVVTSGRRSGLRDQRPCFRRDQHSGYWRRSRAQSSHKKGQQAGNRTQACKQTTYTYISLYTYACLHAQAHTHTHTHTHTHKRARVHLTDAPLGVDLGGVDQSLAVANDIIACVLCAQAAVYVVDVRHELVQEAEDQPAQPSLALCPRQDRCGSTGGAKRVEPAADRGHGHAPRGRHGRGLREVVRAVIG
jgi:hypothetical protein